MSEIKHAPLPWTQYAGGTQVYGGDRYFVGITQSKNAEADAAFIVLACNSYYEAQAALSAKDAELSNLKAGIKRLSDEEELCAETTGDDPFSMVYLTAKLAATEAAKDAEIARLREALEKIVSTNQIREFMGDDKSDGYGDEGWVVRDGQYAQIARAALREPSL